MMENGINDSAAYLEWRTYIGLGMYGSLTIIGAIGNILIVWVYMAHRSMRTNLNLFIVNMAMSDILVSISSGIMGGYQEIYGNWIFGSVACTLHQIIETVGLCVFILSLTMIAMQLHYTILPLSKRNEVDAEGMSTSEIWVTSVILSAPNWIFATVEVLDVAKCHQVWPHEHTGNSLQETYSMFFTFITYVLPLIYMAYRYGRLTVNIWVTKNWSVSPADRQTVKMMIIVVLVYTITSFPLRFRMVFDDIRVMLEDAMIGRGVDQQDVMPILNWLAISDLMYNPIIYFCMDKRFHLGLQKIFRWLPFVHYKKNNILDKTGESIVGMRYQNFPLTRI